MIQTRIFIGGLSLFPWLIVWANSSHGIDFGALLIATIVTGFCLAWLGSFKITIEPTELSFRSLFHGKQIIKHSDIKMVRLEWKFWRTKKGPLRLIIEPRENSNTRKLDINAKVFSRAAINAVLDLGARVAEADDGGLRGGITLKTVKSWRRSKND